MSRKEIINTITPVIREVLNDKNFVITDDLSVENVPNWNSLSFTQMIAEIEKTFNIKFKIMDVMRMQDMGKIIDTIAYYLDYNARN